MEVKSNASLKNINSFQVEARAKFFVEIENEKDIKDLLSGQEFANLPKLILGGGNNILFVKDFEGLIIKLSTKGKKVIKETGEYVILEVAAGEDWHGLVSFAVANNWGGIENLALIPGTVGAAPIQNIAAYGQNFSDVFYSLDAINLETGEMKTFTPSECEFAYRTSIFKNAQKNKFVIMRVRIKLFKNPAVETSYYQIGINRDSIKNELEKISPPHTIKDIYNIVINIRKRKLPDVKVIPNAGSVFLNPVVSRKKFISLQNKVPELQCYPVDRLKYQEMNAVALKEAKFVKVAAGRLLEQSGWLGKWAGNCGIHDKHALIIITNGKASGQEILNFIEMIKKNFFDCYGINLESEINIIN